MAKTPDEVARVLAAIREQLGHHDGYFSCPCGRGDYDLCRKCPYWDCSVHGVTARLLAAAQAVLDYATSLSERQQPGYGLGRVRDDLRALVSRELLSEEGTHLAAPEDRGRSWLREKIGEDALAELTDRVRSGALLSEEAGSERG